MSLRQIEVFRAIMNGGSITEAARLLGVSQPAVSKILRHMEDQLGMRLFHRHAGRLQPAPEAAAIFPEVDQVFERLGLIQKSIENLANPSRGAITIGTIPTLGATLLPPTVANFRRMYPRIKVSLKLLPTQAVIDRVADNRLDLGIIYAPVEDQALQTEELYDAEIICAFRPDHPLADKDMIFPPDLVDHDMVSISRESHFGMAIERAFGSYGLARTNVVEVSHSFVALSLVENGVGVGVVDPFVTMRQMFPGLVFRAFRPRVAINPTVIYTRRTPLSRLKAAFIEHMKKVGIEKQF